MPIFAPVLNVCRTWSDDVAAKIDARSSRPGAADGARVEPDEVAKRRGRGMIRIAITAAAYHAICSTLPEDVVKLGDLYTERDWP
jgi:hypothetical protein